MNVWIVAGAVFFCALAAIAFCVIATIQVGMNRGTFVLGSPEEDDSFNETSGDGDGNIEPQEPIAVDRGYTFKMPRGFYPLERIEKDQGEVCYTFASEQDTSAGCLLCVAPKRGSTIDSEPPLVFAPAPPNFRSPVVQINGIYYLEEDRTEKLRVDGMSAFIHRIEYQRERSGRTISIIGWFMHAMDDGQFVTIRITQAKDTSSQPPKQWRDALLSLRRHQPVNITLIPDEFRP